MIVATSDISSTFDENTDAILIAGPTASGKSKLAIEMAKKHNGVIINTDSMQVYNALRIISARPTKSDHEAVEHFLYGHVHGEDAYSTGHWLREVKHLLPSLKIRHKKPIFVGGTGLFFKALVEGLSEIPSVPDETRNKWRGFVEEKGTLIAYAHLNDIDPEAAKLLKPSDQQRITRALEVYDATGQSLLAFQNKRSEPVLNSEQCLKVVIVPEKETTWQKIEHRFKEMIDEGGVEEVEALLKLGLDGKQPVMKAIGVPELVAFIKGECSLEQAIEKAVISSRQYAKRQRTWFRNQLDESWLRL